MSVKEFFKILWEMLQIWWPAAILFCSIVSLTVTIIIPDIQFNERCRNLHGVTMERQCIVFPPDSGVRVIR